MEKKSHLEKAGMEVQRLQFIPARQWDKVRSPPPYL
jgi:hypothetical protein